MPFINNAQDVARVAMNSVNPALTEKFSLLVEFLAANPAAASSFRGKNSPLIGSEAYIRAAATNFSQGREPKRPVKPDTVPDEMVSVVLEYYFAVDPKSLDRVKIEHALSMGAENIVGDLLERYLASALEPSGWIWCAGSIVKAVDFILPPKAEESWRSLQVKNRDNSENSSSSAIRLNTTIEKWFRTFSKKPGSNWAAFPHVGAHKLLSEENFRIFAKAYLESVKLR